MVEVAGSIPVSRSYFFFQLILLNITYHPNNFCYHQQHPSILQKIISPIIKIKNRIHKKLTLFFKEKSYTNKWVKLVYTMVKSNKLLNYNDLPEFLKKDHQTIIEYIQFAQNNNGKKSK